MRSMMWLVAPLVVLFSAQPSWAARPNAAKYPHLAKGAFGACA